MKVECLSIEISPGDTSQRYFLTDSGGVRAIWYIIHEPSDIISHFAYYFMLDPKNIFPIGMGTWGIGGFAERNPQNDDEKQIKALSYMIDRGVNFIQIPYWYAEGRAVELLSQAIKSSTKKREELFITSSIYHYKNPTLKDAESELNILLNTLDTTYLDSVVFALAASPLWGREESKEFLHKQLEAKKTRFVSVTNFDLASLEEFKKDFGDNLFSHELSLSFEIRENVDFGIVSFADKNNIKNVISQPLRRNRTVLQNWPLLIELSNKYSRSQNQIILNWMVEKCFIPITKSETISHIDEHLDSTDFKIEDEDLKKLDEFRPPNWQTPTIDWYQSGKGVRIDQLANIFDESIDKNK